MRFHPAGSSLVVVLLLMAVLGEACSSQGRAQPKGTPHPVDQELQLAKTKSLYVIIDANEKIALLKARGVPLRTFPLTNTEWIGDPLAQSTVLHLQTKDPLVSPLPISPPPVSSSEAPPEDPLTPLTVNDMPTRYELTFQEHLTILVQPPHLPFFWANMGHQIAGWGERVVARLVTWGSSHQYLILSLDPAEAQALYWAAIPPMTCLVISENPSGK